MKLHEATIGRRGSKASEVVIAEQTATDFDLHRDIPQERWEEAKKAIERFVQDPEDYPAYGQLACSLALLDSELMKEIQSSDKFRQAAELLVKKRWQQALKGEYINRLKYVASIEPFLNPFPEFRKFFSPTTREWESMLAEVKDQDLNQVLEMNEPGEIFFSLIRLFPDRQREIQEILQSDRVKAESFDMAEDVERGADHRLHTVALLRLLYPEETDRIQSLGKESKSKLPKEYFRDHVSMNAFSILDLAITFSEEAHLQPDGSIYLRSKKKGLKKNPKLPERLVA